MEPPRRPDDKTARPPEDARPPAAAEDVGDVMRSTAPYASIGAQIVASMVVWGGLGYLADRWLATTPWLLIAGCVMGMVSIFAYLWKLTKQLEAQDRARRKRTPPRARK